MVNDLFTKKTQFYVFSFLDTILTVLDPDPYSQYESGFRGAISIRIHMDPDPDPDLDPEHWVKQIKPIPLFPLVFTCSIPALWVPPIMPESSAKK